MAQKIYQHAMRFDFKEAFGLDVNLSTKNRMTSILGEGLSALCECLNRCQKVAKVSVSTRALINDMVDPDSLGVAMRLEILNPIQTNKGERMAKKKKKGTGKKC